ncbi:hypothetical protein BL250_14505 [Erwinia sp. OLTSP20]|nr:hypothetical protein BV501_09030 [Erwinia sp. OAMSP11]PIJ72052.1 hypothetical protein BK416_09930 [Erwinia sp. OLSSP12]PIJ81343.1 hypothetical protein BLD47_08755 [Erwinia sp. OLCASP19]PIJ84049.1 hypothetical protein BLD46_08335 [Erwinia sp. OLMTSP26]PIJ85748.1 hypothetical protein BLD49_09555 [Erwinia sp. OLMDSP33]PIJ90076.1 hypothetical protein BL250_14505 [Erwinia sp. OLTSP20]PIJ91937.1 hypothetical protein BL249_06695 [Erwinia sp. OLFS4]
MLVPCILITACQEHRAIPPERAKADIVNNTLCVKVTPQGDEKVRSLFIYEGNNTAGGLMKEFYPQLQVSSNDCLPAPAYPYQAGKTYSWKIDMQSAQKPGKDDYSANRIVTARFIWQQQGMTRSLTQLTP